MIDIEEKAREFALDHLFNDRPGNSSDYELLQMAAERNFSLEGFVVRECFEEYADEVAQAMFARELFDTIYRSMQFVVKNKNMII